MSVGGCLGIDTSTGLAECTANDIPTSIFSNNTGGGVEMFVFKINSPHKYTKNVNTVDIIVDAYGYLFQCQDYKFLKGIRKTLVLAWYQQNTINIIMWKFLPILVAIGALIVAICKP